MSIGVEIKIGWGSLVLDPAHADYLGQAVSVPVPECAAASRVRDSIWWFPVEIVSGQSQHLRRIDFNVQCGEGRLTDDEYASLLALAKGYALARMAKPLVGYVDLATVKRDVVVVFALCHAMASTTWARGIRKLADYTPDDLNACVAIVSREWRRGASGFECLANVLRLINRWGAEGLLPESFDRIEDFDIRMLCGLTGVKRQPHDLPDDRDVHTTPPLPSQYCAQALEIADFYFDKVADPLIEHVTVLAQMRREEADVLVTEHEMSIWDPRRARVRYEKWLRKNPWPVDALPFRVKYPFPPKSSGHILNVLSSVQAAAMHCVGLTVAPRASEFMAMEADCLGESRALAEAGRLTTLRFKGAADSSYPVEWDIPDWVVKAVKIQVRLGKALRAPALWHCVHQSDWGKRLAQMHSHLVKFADLHHLDAAMGDHKTVHAQRFRPTVAREIILSPHGHIRLVQRVLGHKNVATTEGYIKMNPYLAPELTEARYRRIGATPDIRDDEMRVADLADGLTEDVLAEMLRQADIDGESLALLAPGVVLTATAGARAVPPAFECDAVRRAALGFAVASLCRREVRAVAEVYGWYLAEARRLQSTIEDGIPFEPSGAREMAMYELVCRREH